MLKKKIIQAGVDEVGRGCLAGPVVAAAIILNFNSIPIGINDSKKLSNSPRNPSSYCLGSFSPDWRKATLLCIRSISYSVLTFCFSSSSTRLSRSSSTLFCSDSTCTCRFLVSDAGTEATAPSRIMPPVSR